MPSYFDNPAGRLHHTLTQIKRRSRSQQVPLPSVLAEVLSTDKNDAAQLLSRVAEVLALPRQIRDEVSMLNFEFTPELTRELASIEQHMSKLSQSGPAKQWSSGLSPAALSELRICAAILHEFRPEARPEQLPGQGDLDGLAEKISDLLSDVRSSDIPGDLRRTLLSRLNELQYAVDMYPVVGVGRLRDAFERSLVTMGDETFRGRIFRTSLGTKLIGLLFAVDAVLGIATNSRTIIEEFQRELPEIEQQQQEEAPDDAIIDAELVDDELEGEADER